MISEQEIIEKTNLWLEKAVIGLNLCPFARHPFRNGKIRLVPCKPQNEEALAQIVLDEILHLRDTPPSVLETTIVIFPEFLTDFQDYLEFLDITDIMIEEFGFEGVFQIASFHPDYQFEDTEPTDVENFTNRSPYPILHLLREDSMTRAIEAYPEVGDIPEKNIDTMNKLGLEGVQKIWQNFK